MKEIKERNERMKNQTMREMMLTKLKGSWATGRLLARSLRAPDI